VTAEVVPLIALGVFLVALLYSSVGHAGASGYLAVMALLGIAPEAIKPTALMLNVLVAAIASWQFWRAGHVRWALLWPFALLAIPCAFLGGSRALPAPGLTLALGLVLLFSAANLLLRPAAEPATQPPPRPVALGSGAGIGLLAGLTGTGGGIFLTPLLIHLRWASAKAAAAASALFILGNSAAGLAGHFSATQALPLLALPLAAAAIAGGVIGSHYGSRHFLQETIKRFLAGVLTIAGGKLVLTVV
jgi:hypothetical protein